VVPFSEDLHLTQTISPYAATKIAGEFLCSTYSHLYQMRVVALRFFTVYGARQRPDLAIHQFTRRIHAGQPIDQFGDGSTRRDYTYVDDIIQGVTAALRYDGPLFDIFNLGESETIELRTLIAEIERALGRKAQINQLPEQAGDVPLTCADISKAKRLLGYQPTTSIRAPECRSSWSGSSRSGLCHSGAISRWGPAGWERTRPRLPGLAITATPSILIHRCRECSSNIRASAFRD
jgi:UDP-glucuronate 4-epimerase